MQYKVDYSKIKKYRQDNLLSIGEVTEKTGLSVGTIYKIKEGKPISRLSLKKLLKCNIIEKDDYALYNK